MANKKPVSSSRRTTKASAGVSAKRKPVKMPTRRVVDPMMVSSVRARKDDKKLTEVALDNDVDFTEEEDDSFLSDTALYDIDDLYDEKGNLIMDEADEILRETDHRPRARHTMPEMRRANSNTRTTKRKIVSEEEDESGDFDITEDELEVELNRKRKSSQKASKIAEKRRKKAEKKSRHRVPIWAKILIGFLVLIILLLLLVFITL
ncbi:hypothetical protein J6X90_01850 [Candidatus Saccharibacteria bacterium]|nr:hypothetical protein [Candidatus Saccharibacteria bacterium]